MPSKDSTLNASCLKIYHPVALYQPIQFPPTCFSISSGTAKTLVGGLGISVP